MTKLNILFLGAAKRVTLIEQFINAATRLDIKLAIFSCEKRNDFYPISQYAQIVVGPEFKSNAFQNWFKDILIQKKIHLVIPNMDSATVSLSQFALRERLRGKTWFVVSAYDLCRVLEDKVAAAKFFKKNHLPTPSNTPSKFPKILKPRFGFGSRLVKIAESQKLLDYYTAHGSKEDYLVQDLISGQETTVDFYVNRKKKLIGYVLRDRLEISDGEVMVCLIRDPDHKERRLIEKVAAIPGWCGCITLQYIREKTGKIWITEINPRFGGGATASIAAGFDMPHYILSEYVGYNISKPQAIKKIKMTRARRDFYYEV